MASSGYNFYTISYVPVVVVYVLTCLINLLLAWLAVPGYPFLTISVICMTVGVILMGFMLNRARKNPTLTVGGKRYLNIVWYTYLSMPLISYVCMHLI